MVTTSTSEAEFVATASATMEAVWLSKIFIDLQIDPKLPIKMYEDNLGCIFMSQNPETKRSKHIDIKFHFLRECVWNKSIELVPIASKDQLADCMTKSLNRVQFWKLVSEMGLQRRGVS